MLKSIHIRGINMAVFSLTFVRHGETLFNRKNIIQGHTDIPLSSVGEQQAGLVADHLQNVRFTHIYTSDLSRAFETARIISEGNKMCRCDIIVDKQLRERKFGDAEGKSSKELLVAAKNAKKPYRDYTPPGGESIVQFRERAESFFADICKMCTALSANDCIIDTPAKIKSQNGGSLGQNDNQSKGFQKSRQSRSFFALGNVEDIVNDIKIDTEMYKDKNEINKHLNFCNHRDLLTMRDGEALDTSEKVIEQCCSNSNEPAIPRCDLGSVCKGSSSKSNRSRIDGSSHSESNETTSSTPMEHEYHLNNTISDSTVVMDAPVKSNKCEIHTDVAIDVPVVHTRSAVKVNYEDTIMQHYVCSNVALSLNTNPVSSLSSGHNNFHDLRGLPMMIANILIVSHGGFIKETLRYFVEKLNCKIPGMQEALNVCPNCSISKFMVTIDENTGQPSLTCIAIHSKDHLAGLDVPEANDAF